ncbi:ATP synthase subunit f, mitochondrial [Termitomyces sp. J132]|nr:ATP synthase subunit f, mitochondrial [Termitomyces sp. J132]
MHASLVRRQLQGLIPPKIATPKLVSGESGTGLGPLVDFYSKLPKGQATPRVGGIKARLFSGANASGKPIVALIVGLFAIGYTLDYNSASSCFLIFELALNTRHSAPEYVDLSLMGHFPC